MASRSYQVRRSKTGLGLFATKQIKRGAYIATYRGPRITTAESDRREARGARYMFALNKKWVIDGSPRWNAARYINHSCRPNCYVHIQNGTIWIRAARKIRKGEELTYHYNTDGEGLIKCRCHPKCQHLI